MQLHDLKRNTKRKKSRRVGRGGKRGKTSGRGTKGQKARAGRKLRPEIRDTIKKLPKRRGYGKNRARTVNSGKMKPVTVSLSALSAHFGKNAEITPESLRDAGLVRARGGKLPPVKILATGDISVPMSFRGVDFSASARERVEKAGGSVAEN